MADSSSSTPRSKQDDATPALVESPEASALTGRLLEKGEACSDQHHDHNNNNINADKMERYLYHYARFFLEKLWAMAEAIQIVLEEMYDRTLWEIQRIAKNKTEKRRYQMTGAVLAYALIMYLCTWTISTPAHLVTRNVEQNGGNGDILVKVYGGRPVTFLNSRRWQMATSIQNNNNTSTETDAATTKQVQKALKENGSRWVSLQHGHCRTFNPFLAIWRFILRQFTRPSRVAEERMLQALDNHPYPHAFTQEPLLSDQDMDFMEAWSDRLTDQDPEWHGRVAKVAWGGRSKWWHPHYARSSYYPLETIDGGNLLYPYYQAMNRGGRCGDRSFSSAKCDAQAAILSTLEWRESYKPWRATVDVIVSENYHGWVYARGLSKPSPYGRHGLVWLRAGQHRVQNSTSYTRSIVYSVERAIAAALRRGRVGRANIIVDVKGYEWSKIPDFPVIKEIFTIFQDYYPGRLGAIFLCNMSPAAEILFSLVKPLVDKAVLDKIYILPQNAAERNQELETFIAPEHIPTWLGGKDHFQFDVAYYNADVSHLDPLPSLQ